MRHHAPIYRSWSHLIFPFLLITVPFIFVLVSAKITKVPDLGIDFLASFYRMAIATLISALLGWIFAVMFYKGRRALIALPIFDVLQSFPNYAILPVGILFLGQNNLTVIIFLVLTIIWPVFFSVINSLKLVRHDWEEAAEILNLRGFAYLYKFIWPISLPGLITGTIIGVGSGWEALIATEIIAKVVPGLGNFFQSQTADITVTVFGVLAFLIIIFSLNKLIWLPLLEKSHERLGE